MIICTSPQGSEGWHKDRAGCITGSMFGEIMKVSGGLTDQQQTYVEMLLGGMSEKDAMELAGYKAKPKADKIARALAGERVGDWTEAAKSYAFRVAVERISGEPLDEGFETWAMRRGHELEPEARASHGFIHDLEIEECGFIKTDDGKFGVSADGLIEPDGGSEYKCFFSPDSLRPIVVDGDIEPYIPQCQGGLWLTGRKFWHFGLYCPALTGTNGGALRIFPMERDEDYIAGMERTLVEFDRLVESYREKLLAD